jgi:hypothetical protein
MSETIITFLIIFSWFATSLLAWIFTFISFSFKTSKCEYCQNSYLKSNKICEKHYDEYYDNLNSGIEFFVFWPIFLIAYLIKTIYIFISKRVHKTTLLMYPFILKNKKNERLKAEYQ